MSNFFMSHYGRAGQCIRFLLTVLCLMKDAHGEAPTEYQVKAGFLYNFTKFVSWPAESFSSQNQPFIICTFGGSDWEQTFQETLKSKTINERVAIVRSIHNEKEAKGCHVIFLPATDHSRLESIAINANAIGILTVMDSGDNKKNIRTGAVITLVLDANRVRFVINMKAAEKAKLTISSKLLSLALEVQQ